MVALGGAFFCFPLFLTAVPARSHDGPMPKLRLVKTWIDDELLAWLRRRAAEEGSSLSSFVRRILLRAKRDDEGGKP